MRRLQYFAQMELGLSFSKSHVFSLLANVYALFLPQHTSTRCRSFGGFGFHRPARTSVRDHKGSMRGMFGSVTFTPEYSLRAKLHTCTMIVNCGYVNLIVPSNDAFQLVTALRSHGTWGSSISTHFLLDWPPVLPSSGILSFSMWTTISDRSAVDGICKG